MPKQTPIPSGPATQPDAAQLKTDFNIGDEFGTVRKNLPPIKIVLTSVAVIAAIGLIFSFTQLARSSASGSIDDVESAEVPDQSSVMVAINVSVQNQGTKPYWIRTIRADVEAANANFSDDAASTADFERYLQAFPALKQHALAPLAREAKINPGEKVQGTILVLFPSDAFANRKSLKVTIQPYDQPVPLVITK